MIKCKSLKEKLKRARVLFPPLEGPPPTAPALISTGKWLWPEGPALH